MKPTNLVMGHAAFYPHTPVPVGIAKPLPKMRVVKKAKKPLVKTKTSNTK